MIALMIHHHVSIILLSFLSSLSIVLTTLPLFSSQHILIAMHHHNKQLTHNSHSIPQTSPSPLYTADTTIHISLHPHFLIQHKQPTPNCQRLHFSRENRQKRLCLKSRQFPHLPPFPLLPETTHHAPIVSSNKHDSRGVDRHRSPAGFWKVPRPLFSFAEAPDSAVRGKGENLR